MTEYKQKKIITAKWYVGWGYCLLPAPDCKVRVRTFNGAGQNVGVPTTPMTRVDAVKYIDDRKIARAKDMGALINVVDHDTENPD